MKDFEIRCDESRLEKNNTLYGKFSLGPFLPGQGTTFGNALRRSLLSELSGLGITAFEIIGVMQEFSTLPGLRESVLDLSLNLKQIVLTGVLPFSTPPIGFLKVRGPAIIYAADLKLPPGVYCAAPKQYIGTLSSNGVLNLKFLVSVGKGHSTQPYSLYRSLSKVKLQPWKRESTFLSNSINKGLELHRPEVKNDATLFDDEWKNSNWKNNSNSNSRIASNSRSELELELELRAIREYKERELSVAEIEKTRHIAGPTPGTSLQPSNTTTFGGEAESDNYQKKGTILECNTPGEEDAKHDNSHDAQGAPVLETGGGKRWKSESRSQRELNTKIALNNASNSQIASNSNSRIASNSRSELELRPSIASNSRSELELELGNGGLKYVNIQKQTFQRVNPHQVLPIDAVFTPVSQVNFLTQVNDRFETPRENVVLEIWTNGSIHPKRALEEAALSLVQNFDTLLKNIQQASSFHKGLRYSPTVQSFNEGAKKNNLEHKEKLRKKIPSIIGKFNLANVPLHQAIYKLDIGNLDLSLETFILLKQAKIKNLAHLLKNLDSKEGKFFVKVEEPFLQHNTVSIDKKNRSEEELAISNIDKDKGCSFYRGQTKTKGESFCLNEKIIEELSNIFSQLGINL